MKHWYAKIIQWNTILILLAGAPLYGQGALKIERIQPYIQNDTLMCAVAVPNLLSGNIKQTLLSGLPVLVELSPTLIGDGQQKQAFKHAKYRLTYDIWEDLYLMESAALPQTFSSLQALQNYWYPMNDVMISTLQAIKTDDKIILQMELRVILLTRSQSQKFRDWVGNPSETQEIIPSLNRDAGFKLNLNQLVSLFISKDDVIESFEASQRSLEFNISELKATQGD